MLSKNLILATARIASKVSGPPGMPIDLKKNNIKLKDTYIIYFRCFFKYS